MALDRKTTVLLLDTETTGLVNSEVVELTVKLRDAYLTTLAKPQNDIKPEAMAIHHITNEQVAKKKPLTSTLPAQVLEAYNESNNFLVGHNIGFDITALTNSGVDVTKYNTIDTLILSKKLLQVYDYKLNTLVYSLDLHKSRKFKTLFPNGITSHRTETDVKMLSLLWDWLLSKYSIQELFDLQKKQDPVIIELMPFGKFKGTPITEVLKSNPGYLRWAKQNVQNQEDFMFTLQQLGL